VAPKPQVHDDAAVGLLVIAHLDHVDFKFKAAELLGLTRLGFVALLARKGIQYFRLTPDEWPKEAATATTWTAARG
jgi:hypothetical protein